MTCTEKLRPKALDLFCGAGGAAMGLWRAGFDVVGVDIEPQPRYPFLFIRADALRPPFRLEDFDLVWASPPCQAFTSMRFMWNRKVHPNLIPATRAMLKSAGMQYVIENVPGAPLEEAHVRLCGTMFGLGTLNGQAELRRHRLFETTFGVLSPPCQHGAPLVVGVYGGHCRDRRRLGTVGVYGNVGGHNAREKAQKFLTAQRREVMGIDWMTNSELSESIPPAYSQHIGRYAFMALNLDPDEYERGEL